MLQRSEGSDAGVDCDDEMVVLACQLGTDACPAACKDDSKEDNSDEKVKSGSLVVTADAASGRSAVKGGDSDLDTLTFKTSEEVEITKVVLERYGYSDASDIEGVRLENSDGKVVADEKSVNSKDQVTLSIKKDYRKVDGSEDWTVVVALTGAASGSTIGFKVVDVTSTAKDVDLGNYKPYLYDIVTYTANQITLNDKSSDKDYNYEEGEMYEVAKLKFKASSSALEINGFTLTNSGATPRLDLKDFLDKVEVSVDGENVKGVKYTIDDDELNISFDSYEVEAKWSATFTVKISLKDYDKYGQTVKFVVDKTSDVKITEKKTWARVSVTLPSSWKGTHKFVGSKIKLSSKKLGSVDAAQGSTDIVVLEWDIEIAEAIDKFNYTVTATYANLSGDTKSPIEEMKLVVAGDEYTASPSYSPKGTPTTVSGTATFEFKNVEIEKSGKVQVLIDVDSDATQWATVTLTPTLSSKELSGARYSEARETVNGSEVKGSISFATKVTIQPSKAALENNLTKRVEFVTNETSKKTVFDGTYTAKKGDVKLNSAVVTGKLNSALTGDITFYVTIDGESVATIDPQEEETFSEILVKAGESVKVKVEAEISADEVEALWTYTLILKGRDNNDNDDAGKAEENLVEMRIVGKGTVSVTNEKSSKNTVLLKARNTTLAEFTIKPSNNNEGLTLEDVVITGTIGNNPISGNDIKLKVDGVEYDMDSVLDGTGIVYLINEELPTAGFPAEIVLKNETGGKVDINVVSINGSTQNKKFSKSFADALVYIASQKNEGSYTQYRLGIELYDDSYNVTGFVLWTGLLNASKECTGTGNIIDGINAADNIYDGDEFSINNLEKTTQTIRCIEYYVNGTKYAYDNSGYADYFKVDGSAWRIFSNN